MLKKFWIVICLGLFLTLTVGSPDCLEYQGQTINPETIKNLPPEVRQQLASDLLNNTSDDNGALASETSLGQDNFNYPSDSTETDSQDQDKNLQDTGREKRLQQPLQHTASIIEQQYRQGYSSSIATHLNQFGYDIFNTATTKPSSLAVPDSNYMIGTGDNLIIRMWGTSMDAVYPAVVDREGIINIPKLGFIPVAGVKYGEIEAVVKKEAEKYIQGINLNITLSKLRSLEIYVVGEVNSPGLHMLPAFSTIFDALLYAGGVKKTGTLRGIKLYRNNREIQAFDLYDLLLKGNRKSDKTLQNKDVIFVGEIGKIAAVAGAVNNQAIFEITGTNSIKDILTLAGGILPQAFGDRIYLRRFTDNNKFIVQDIDTPQKNKNWNQIKINNGDLLEFDFMDTRRPHVVRISGNVWKPDVYNYQPGMKLSQILISPDLLMPNTLMDFGLIYRYDSKTTRTKPIRFPLKEVFEKKYDTIMKPLDRIVILSMAEIGIRETFTINGAVWKDGEYSYQPGIRLKEALALAGGITFGGAPHRIEIARQTLVRDKMITNYILKDAQINGDFQLHPYDSILVPRVKDAAKISMVTLSGEVRYPGTYAIRENDKISDLILRAGGFTEDAYFYGAKYTSESARKIQQKSVDTMIEKLELAAIQTSSEMGQSAVSKEDAEGTALAQKAAQDMLAKLKEIRAQGRVTIKLAELDYFKDSIYDFRLENGDTIQIPKKPMFVSVIGSVYSAGSFLYESDQKVDDYLEKSGGPTKTADKKYTYLLKANGEIISMAQHNGFFSKFGNTVVHAGDTLVVPENLDRVTALRMFKDVTDIIFKIATTAGIAFAI